MASITTQKERPVAGDVSDAESSEWEFGEEEVQQPKYSRKGNQSHVLEKDDAEEELERLVLGDKAGFRAKLFEQDTVEDAEEALRELTLARTDDDNDDEDKGLEDAGDANLFFYENTQDMGTVMALAETTKQLESARSTAKEDVNAAAWVDSDDERLSVSLANGKGRLNRLRVTEDEDVISGTEYANRLQQQYLRLHPDPEWAVSAWKRQRKQLRRKKKRREAGLDDSDSSDFEEDDEEGDGESGGSDDDEEDALPLDEFLRSASALAGVGGNSDMKLKKRRLRPEVIDIEHEPSLPTRHKKTVTAIAFHPTYPVLFTASEAATMHLHHIAPTAHPTPHPLLTTVRVRRLPILRASFLDPENGDQILFAGRRPFFHTWNIRTGKVRRIKHMTARSHGEVKTMERIRVSPTGKHLAVIGTDRKGGGILNILDAHTMLWTAQARLESRGGIADFQWWRNGEGITMLGMSGCVGEFRLSTQRFVGIWQDEGSSNGTTLALGGRSHDSVVRKLFGGDRWVAVGSKTGIVNVYDRNKLIEKVEASALTRGEQTVVEEDEEAEDYIPHYVDDDEVIAKDGATTTTSAVIEPVTLKKLPAPERAFDHLDTVITSIVFTPDGQLMAMASRHKQDALRLVHLPSCTVFRNWPTKKTRLGLVTAIAFSPASDLLAIGNDVGKTRLWAIRR